MEIAVIKIFEWWSIRYSKNVSFLFEKIDFKNENPEYINQILSDEYVNQFDFHYFNSSYTKTNYEIQNELIKNVEILKGELGF